MPRNTLEQIEILSRADWRAWLEAHHEQRESIWLVSYKKNSSGPYVEYGEIVEECLCFGWIDSQAKALDADRSMILCSPRRAGSPWSASNKKRVTRLKRLGLMTPAGQAKIDAAKRDGSWTVLDDVEKLIVPDDLGDALDEHDEARSNYNAFPPSVRKGILWWIKSAKRAETRANRIRKAAEAAARNERIL